MNYLDFSDELFLSVEHKERFYNLVETSKCYITDSERLAVFFILAGNDDLYMKRDSIYDFNNSWHIGGCINPQCFETTDFSSGVYKLVNLAFNLYNNYNENDKTLLDLFSGLDGKNFKLALNSIIVRFS